MKDLVENGADVTANDNEAVEWAIENGYLDIVKFLVEHGADITANIGEAARLASIYGHDEVVEYLVNEGFILPFEQNVPVGNTGLPIDFVEIEDRYLNEEGEVVHNCMICTESMDKSNSKRLKVCTHIYHEECIRTWGQISDECPACRRKMYAKMEIV